MGKTIFLLFGVCLCFAICELLLPGPQGGTRRALHFLLSLTVLVILAAPLATVLGSDFITSAPGLAFEEGEQEAYAQIFEEALQAQSEQDLKSGIAQLLQREYGIAEKNCEILCCFSVGGELLEVRIYLSGAALTTDPLVLKKELEGRLGCPVEVR